MKRQELYQRIAEVTGDDMETINTLGFELHIPQYQPNPKEIKRLRRLRLWRQQRRHRRLAEIIESQERSNYVPYIT